MLSTFAAVMGALCLSMLGGYAVARHPAPRQLPSRELPSRQRLPVWLVLGFTLVLGAVCLLLFASNLPTAALLLVPAGVLFGGLAYRSTAVPQGRYSPEEVSRITRRRNLLFPAALAVIVVAALSPLGDRVRRRSVEPPDSTTSGRSSESAPGLQPSSLPSASDTQVIKTIDKSLRLSLRGDLTPLARVIESLSGKGLPAALEVAAIATEAGRKFASSVAERSGQNLSDLLFEWLKREETYSAEEQRASRVASDTARPAPALHVVRFDHGHSELPASGVTLAGDIAYLHRASHAIIFLVGSADRTGGNHRNLRLANERASKVARALTLHGVPDLRIFRLVRPESAAPVPTPDGILEPENRRVEVWIR
jgi:outer membrane protein OmpA-like peptidoglycan-associated protein